MAAQRSSAAKSKKPAASKRNAPAVAASKTKKSVAAPVVKAKPKGKEIAKETKPKAAPVVVKVKAAAAPAAVVSKKPAAAAKPAGPAVKVSNGLSKGEMVHFRDLLLEKRREILGDVGTMESEAFKSGSNLSNMPIHMADVGTDNFEQEFTLGLIESERQMLREIQEALSRLENGTFGICVATGKPINKVRLEAVPWAKYTMEYARALERGEVRRENGGHKDDEGGDDDEE